MNQPREASGHHVRIAADVGGTFTDVAIFDEATATLRLGKTLTTPQRMVDGIADGVAKADANFADAGLFLHGTTVAINTMLERSGAKTALVTTRGFRDVYEIGRINRPDAYNLFFRKHTPLVPRSLRFEVTERLNVFGQVDKALDLAELEEIAKTLAAEKVEAVAILFLHSYRNAVHERAAKDFFEKRLPGVFVTSSHELSQEYREFERTSTVAANAYVGPRVKNYLNEITARLETDKFRGRFFVVQSTGGLYECEQAKEQCIRMLESGPSAGVIGTKVLCQSIGLTQAIPFDMGGTTAKAGVVIDGAPVMANNVMIGGYGDGLPIQIPMIDIREIGTGGGSIARVGAGNSLRVGPESAGARPGPACYGLGGTQPTVTDANLVLGRLSAAKFLGGDLKLDVKAAREALARVLAKPLGLTVEMAATGIIQIAASMMSNVVRRVTVERGLDARDFAMVAFGGAGPLHATLVARELHINRIIIPNAPGHFSAFGMLVTDMRRDFVRTVFSNLQNAPFDEFVKLFDEMMEQGTRELRSAAQNLLDLQLQVGADMRYVGQEHAVSVDLPRELFQNHDIKGIKTEFDRVHRMRYGFASEDSGVELVSLRCALTGVLPKPEFRSIEQGSHNPEAALLERRPVYFDSADGFQDAPVYRRDKLVAGNRIVGPALIEEYGSTTLLLDGDVAEVDGYGHLVISVVQQ